MSPTPSEVGRGICREILAEKGIREYQDLFRQRAAFLNDSTSCSGWEIVGFVYDREHCLHPILGVKEEKFRVLGGRDFGRYNER